MLEKPFGFIGFFTMPKKAYSQSAITRLSQVALKAACDEWGVDVPPDALDLEIRALLARAISGGSSVVAKACVAPGSEGGKVEASKAAPAKVSVENPFEEFQLESSCPKVGAQSQQDTSQVEQPLQDEETKRKESPSKEMLALPAEDGTDENKTVAVQAFFGIKVSQGSLSSTCKRVGMVQNYTVNPMVIANRLDLQRSLFHYTPSPIAIA